MTDLESGPSAHLSWWELGCHDGTPYPQEFRTDRAPELARAFERIRELCEFALIVDSAYRTTEYNASIGGAAGSQHIQGRALDLKPAAMPKGALGRYQDRLNRLLSAAKKARSEKLLNGIGIYDGFIHIDTRPGTQVTWYGSRTSNTPK